MTEEQIKALTVGDATTWAIVLGLVHFLERIGTLKRPEFIGFLHEMISHWEKTATEIDATTFRILKSKVRSLEFDRDHPVSLQ